MPRQYSQAVFQTGNIATSDDINNEMNTDTSEFNGLLDQNQTPLAAVVASKFLPPEVVVEYDGVFAGYPEHKIAHTYMQSQSYHVSEFCGENTNPQPPPGTPPPYTIFSPLEWTLGWIKLTSKRLTYDGSKSQPVGSAINFEAKEGMLVGEIMFDADWRQSFKVSYYNNPPFQQTPQPQVWFLYDATMIEVGVFVNDTLVATTDQQSLGGRYTFVLPFSVPIGTQSVTVDIRFRLILNNKFGGADGVPTQGWDFVESKQFLSTFFVHDSLIWVRNQYR